MRFLHPEKSVNGVYLWTALSAEGSDGQSGPSAQRYLNELTRYRIQARKDFEKTKEVLYVWNRNARAYSDFHYCINCGWS
jgi:hypothetical protein